jgi:DNA repair protein RecN (Recombination protein N)
MIQQLSIENIALIDQLNLEFDNGLNILTGETGAGKSILIDAVNLALGERADRELIQTGKDAARVEILFSLKDNHKINNLLNEYGILPEEDGSLLLMRELTIQGRNTCKINGRNVTLSMLREISRHLVDIHGQHQHQSILNPESHLSLLDRLGGREIEQVKEQLGKYYRRWREIMRETKKITGSEWDVERQKDLIRYQIDEISKVNPSAGEEESLRRERTVLIHAEKIIHTISEAYQDLYTGSSALPSASDILGKICAKLSQISDYDDGLKDITDILDEVRYRLEDAISKIREYKDFFEYDPYRLDAIENRLEQLNSLKRKYGKTIEEVLQYQTELMKELQELENSSERLEQLQNEKLRLYSHLVELCRKLSKKRREMAVCLEKELVEHLKSLNMEKTKFTVNLINPELAGEGLDPNNSTITENGYDTVEFLISTNPGEPLKPLTKIVSGGEMSRIMLSFKTIMGDMDEIPTLIFDEIDVGISGRTASRAAEKLGCISKNHQVICVTHLPQIAAMADAHFSIRKTTETNRTRTTVKRLNFQERQSELARMIGGENLTRLSLDHASELITQAENQKNKKY